MAQIFNTVRAPAGAIWDGRADVVAMFKRIHFRLQPDSAQ